MPILYLPSKLPCIPSPLRLSAVRWRGHPCFQGYLCPNPDLARRGAGVPGMDAGKGEGGNDGFTVFGKYVSRYTFG